MTAPFQMNPDLDAETLAGLRESIAEHGLLVPILIDQYERILDGHHRAAICEDLDIPWSCLVVEVKDDKHAWRIAAEVNAFRRHLGDPEQRVQAVADLRAAGASYRAIAKQLGITLGQAQRDQAKAEASGVSTDTPDAVTGLDGKTYPSTRPDVPGFGSHRMTEDEFADPDPVSPSDADDAGEVEPAGTGAGDPPASPDKPKAPRPQFRIDRDARHKVFEAIEVLRDVDAVYLASERDDWPQFVAMARAMQPICERIVALDRGLVQPKRPDLRVMKGA